ncbi:MAG: hypothetical protein J7L31_06205 [Thermoplasmata archaeon]|nr:hypothetical protein [Thermoplasmata archaeon]
MKIKFGEKDAQSKSKESKELGQITNWIQKFKQNLDSLEKRVDAIERRLSGEPFKMTKFGEDTKAEGYESVRGYVSKMEQEISLIRKEIEKIKGSKGIVMPNTESKEVVISLKKRGGEISNGYAKHLANIERRLERLEKIRKATATVKVGKIEVPFEVTGLIGGFLAFLIAILLFEGYKELVISPPFVMFIGLVLLTATALKTYLINVSRR